MNDKQRLRLKKIATVFALVLSLPASLAIGLAIADPFYLRYQYDGLIQDLAPGDAFGVLLDGIFFSALIFVPTCFLLIRLLERFMKQSRELTR